MEIFEKAIDELTTVKHWEIGPEDFHKHLQDSAQRVAAIQDQVIQQVQVEHRTAPTKDSLHSVVPEFRHAATSQPDLRVQQSEPCTVASAPVSNCGTPVATLIRAYETNRAVPSAESAPRPPMWGTGFHADPVGGEPTTTGPSPTKVLSVESDVPPTVQISGVSSLVPACGGFPGGSEASAPHLPMSDPVHAKPDDEHPAPTGPSHDTLSKSEAMLVPNIETSRTHPPMISNVHAEPAREHPVLTGPSHKPGGLGVPATTVIDASATSTPAASQIHPPMLSDATAMPTHDPTHQPGEDNTLPYTSVGGVNFASTKRAIAPADDLLPSKRLKIAADHCDPTAPWTCLVQAEPALEPVPVIAFESTAKITVHISIWPDSMTSVSVPVQTTVAQLIAAEAKLHNITTTFPFQAYDVVGRSLNDDATLVHDMVIVLTPHDFSYDFEVAGIDLQFPEPQRTRFLWHQGGFVAQDEMKFYLQHLKTKDKIVIDHPMVIQSIADLDMQLSEFLGQSIEIHQATNQHPFHTATVCLVQGHWFPLRLRIRDNEVVFKTTPDGFRLVQQHAPSLMDSCYSWVIVAIGQEFLHDCGFQCIQWLSEIDHAMLRIQPMSAFEAIVLRHEFAVFLADPATRTYQYECQPICLGGASESQLVSSLQTLLHQHGVAHDRSNQCAQHLLKCLGHKSIAHILGAPNPWKDLKTKATQHNPPIQIVLSAELQQVVQDRIKQGKPFGKKATKNKSDKGSTAIIKIQPSQICLPDGIFKQADGKPLGHIPVTQISSNSSGVALASIEEALPFFTLQSPISAGGIALIVLDHQDSRLPSGCELIKFPAQFRATDEPVLLTGALLQLGQTKVIRALPDAPTSIDEIQTQAIRVLVYRDEFDMEWTSFMQSPVRHLTEHEVFSQMGSHDLIDVWDRQVLDSNFKKVAGSNAFLYAVNFRVPSQTAQDLHFRSGVSGIYVEPRSDNGRMPCPDHSVIWLPKRGLRETLLTAQTSEIKCSVARNGLRYGLRVPRSQAADLHKAHRPDLDYIEGSTKQTFRIGPLPWGTTKQSLQKVFAKWGWPARVGQPAGQAADNHGVFWSAIASQNPSHWVFTMTHGDVLITRADNQQETGPKPSHGIVASVRTIKAITKVGELPQDSGSDPWLVHDPWGKFQPQKPIVKDQLAAMEASITTKVKAAIQATEDVHMPAAQDSRVQALEDQVKTLSANFNQMHSNLASFQQQQQQHNTQVASQVTTLKSQVESQASSLQGMIESKLDDQMTRLEALLSKRMRSGEWPAAPWLFANKPVSIQLTDAQIQSLQLYSIIYRIGEAKNPGPNDDDVQLGLTIGVANPTGLLTKASSLASLPGTVPAIWGISESQLSAAGIRKFHKELTAVKSAYRLFPSAPAPLRSNSVQSIGGKPVGTAFLTTLPSKPLQHTWEDSVWQQARFNANTFLCQGQWIHGAVCYGFAHQANTRATREATDALLSAITYRIVHSLPGKRFIGGDFNQLDGHLEQTKIWAALGWKEVQQLSAERYGTQPELTCKHTTTKDFLWISPELCPFFDRCILDHNLYKDHAALAAIFKPFGKPERIPLWRKPKTLDWSQVGTLPDQQFQLDMTSQQDLCLQVASVFEARVAANLTAKNVSLLPCEQGRSANRDTRLVATYDKPCTNGRAGDYTPQFHGVSLQHARWVKQLRRLESFSRTSPSHATIAQRVHSEREWRAILTSPGFPGGFRRWWKSKPKTTCGVLSTLPFDPPTPTASNLLRAEMEIELQALEKILIRDLTDTAKQRRADDPHVIFRDLKAPKTPLVALLSDSKEATLSHICTEELALELQTPVEWHPDLPIHTSEGPVSLIHAEADKIWVHDLPNLQPGAKLYQELYIGHLHDMFTAFQQEWVIRWDRHLHTPESAWDPLLMEEHVPVGPPLPYAPITIDEWHHCLRSKKRTAAVGPDGWSRADLQAMPADLTKCLLAILEAVESGRPWPQSLMLGLIHNLQKHEFASTVAHYRPITLCSLIYRCWSSIRARQLLKHFSLQAASTICGNMPKKTTKDVWYTIQTHIEHSQTTNTPAAGCVIDLIKLQHFAKDTSPGSLPAFWGRSWDCQSLGFRLAPNGTTFCHPRSNQLTPAYKHWLCRRMCIIRSGNACRQHAFHALATPPTKFCSHL